jgi:hypothetical protein
MYGGASRRTIVVCQGRATTNSVGCDTHTGGVFSDAIHGLRSEALNGIDVVLARQLCTNPNRPQGTLVLLQRTVS